MIHKVLIFRMQIYKNFTLSPTRTQYFSHNPCIFIKTHTISPQKNKSANKAKTTKLTDLPVNPWGVEPQSKEPESFILSIELRVQEK